MNSIKISTFTLLLFFAVSCNNSSNNHKHEEIAIELNNGEKWTVNAEMTPYILDAEQILRTYNGSDHEGLAEQLKAKNKGLIKSCTMNGKSHEELHKWLHPHMQLIEDLGEADNKTEADEIIAQLKASFQNYHQYFQ